MFCTKCGSPLPENAKFCSRCGAPTGITPQSAPAAGPAQSSPAQPAGGQYAYGQQPAGQAYGQPADGQTYGQAPYGQQPVYGDFFSRAEYFIDEHVQVFKFHNIYDIYDERGQKIGSIEQEKIGGGAIAGRLLLGNAAKSLQKFTLHIKDMGGNVQATITRGGVGKKGGVWTTEILNSAGVRIGALRVKMSLKPKMEIWDANGIPVGMIQGNWRGWEFHLTDSSGTEVGTINKKWAGFAKEFFTTADKYHVTVHPSAAGSYRTVVVSAAIAVDMILKEY